MKIFNSIFRVSVLALAALTVFSCREDSLVKPSALISEPSLTFAAVGAEAQTLTVASDDDWFLDVNVDWITLGQMSGTNTEKVTVSVADNKSGNVVGVPREGVISIANRRGYTVQTIIYQKGDSYFGADNVSLSQVAGLEDGTFAKVPDVQVLAVGDEGFVAKDASSLIYCTYEKEVEPVAAGSKLSLCGEKTTLYGLASLKVGQIDVQSLQKPEHGTPVDLAAGVASGADKSVAYVSTFAGILGRTLNYETPLPGGMTATVLEPDASIDLDGVNMHNIAIEAYYVGHDGSDIKLLAVKCEDKGVNENLDAYFYEDFSWMKPFIDASGVKVGDSIGENNASADAPNLRTSANLSDLLAELLKRGYEDLNQSAKVIYPQAYYWKFGKTNANGGMKLPKVEMEGSELVNVYLEFDWAAHMTGSGNIDNVQLVAEIEEGPGVFDNGTAACDPLYTTQTKGKLEWQHVKLEVRGVNNETRFVLRPDKFAEAVPDQQRWHLDNVKIKNTGVAYSDPVYANLNLSDEVLTFEGTPGGPAVLKISSDYPWTISMAPGNEWFSLDVMQGAAGEEVTVNVTCEPSASVNLRHGVMVLSSADTRKNIHVVQSAAGGQLDPLISVTRASVTVLGEGEYFNADVQANVEYEVEIQDEWISDVTVSTRSVVEKKMHSFKAAPNTTGAPRTGHVRFYNEAEGIESVLTVRQENFEPRIDAVVPNAYLGLSGLGGTVSCNIDSNMPFTISCNADWITLPANNGVAGVYKVPVTFAANVSADSRTAEITFANEEYGYSKTLTVNQFGKGIIFFDNFDWVQPVVDKAKETKAANYDTVGEHDLKAEAPNIYTTAALNSLFVPLRDAIGYYIPGKNEGANNVVYLQENYLKMGKTSTSSQTSLTLPAMYVDGKNFTLSFDWCRMEQGDGTIDAYTITLAITGNGTFENGTKYSDELTTPQAKGEMYWTNVGAKVIGADNETRITVVATALLDKSTGKIDYTKSGGKRIFIDNIKAVAE